MQRRNLKFALILNGTSVRNIEELRANFDPLQILFYYENGELYKWLNQRGYMDISAEIRDMKKNDPIAHLSALFEILGIPEEHFDISKVHFAFNKAKRLERLKDLTSDKDILDNIHNVVFSQVELEEKYKELEANDSKKGTIKIYLAGLEFRVSQNYENVEYVGINTPKVYLIADKQFEASSRNIQFQNVFLTADRKLFLHGTNLDVQLDSTKIQLKDNFKELVSVINVKEVLELGKNVPPLAVDQYYIYKNIVVTILKHDPRMEPCIILINSSNKEIIKTIKLSTNVQWFYRSDNNLYYVTREYRYHPKERHVDRKYAYYHLYRLDLEILHNQKVGKIGFLQKFYMSVNYISVKNNEISFYCLRNETQESTMIEVETYFIPKERGELATFSKRQTDNCTTYNFYKGELFYIKENALYNINYSVPIMMLTSYTSDFYMSENYLFVQESCKRGVKIYDLRKGVLVKNLHHYFIPKRTYREAFENTVVFFEELSIEFWSTKNLILTKSIPYEDMKKHSPYRYLPWVIEDLYLFENDVIMDLSDDQFAVVLDTDIYVYK